ncbi:hypothetical protein MRX96_017063 [Rhipicephalus microplus]
MTESGSTEFISREVEELFQRGLRQGCLRCNTHCQTTWNSRNGADLFYWEGISYKDAAVLRRMFLAGPAIGNLCMNVISLAACKVAFRGLEACPSLKKTFTSRSTAKARISEQRSQLDLEVCTHWNCAATTPGRDSRGMWQTTSDRTSLWGDLVLWNSCGGDEGVAVLKALTVNDTLMRFSVSDKELSSDTLIGFVKMLATNSTLEFVNLNDVCPVEKNEDLLVVGAGLARSHLREARHRVARAASAGARSAHPRRRVLSRTDTGAFGRSRRLRGNERAGRDIDEEPSPPEPGRKLRDFRRQRQRPGRRACSKKVRSSPGLVERVRDLTGETAEAVLKEIRSLLARLSL